MTVRENVLNYLAQANGFDQTFKNRSYPGVVYSPSIRWLMSDEANLHWLVSDMMVLAGPMGPSKLKAALAQDWCCVVKYNPTPGVRLERGEEIPFEARVDYLCVDCDTGEDVVVYTQYYDSVDFKQKLKFYIKDHIDGGRACKLVHTAQES